MYKIVRSIHLLLASFSLPFLVMYGVSAVQMSHGTWFTMKPVVQQRVLALTPGQTDARAVARDVMDRERSIRGEMNNAKTSPQGITLRIVVPGTVHDVQYDPASGTTRVKSSVAGVMGMLNRLHHAAGLWHEMVPLKWWAAAVAIVSAALLLLGATGIYMWFARRQERRLGMVLLAANAVVAIVMLTLMHSAGP